MDGGRRPSGGAHEVAVCEPQHRGPVHAPFNAAMLESLRLALPAWRVTFLADPSHLDAVAGILREAGRRTDGLVPLGSPLGERETWGRADHVRPIRALARFVRRHRAGLAIVTSFTAYQLAAARLLLPGRCGLLAVSHDSVADFAGGGRTGPAAVVDALRSAALRSRGFGRTVVCVLGRQALDEARRNLPDAGLPFAAIRHPYLFAAPPGEEEITRRLREPVFVLVGNTLKGKLEELVAAIGAVRARDARVRFVLAGSLWTGNPALDALGADAVEPGTSTDMLDWPDFVRRIRSASFGVVHLDPATYRARASGAVLDTFSACLPSFLRSVPFVDSCCDGDGIPATRYESREDLQRRITDAVTSFPPAAYAEQVRDIAERRVVFSPENVALEIRALVARQLGIEAAA
ncbi:MAG: hypothetical protein KJ062_14465 [Thermoanaerobaculia bacterium]|nr:hypothetical protein [Thermoanaerobaculia bacterium]